MGTLQTELAKIKPRYDGSEQTADPNYEEPELPGSEQTVEPPKGDTQYECAVTGKIRFLSRRAAQRHADTLSEKAYAYLCRFCNGFHFSRKHWRQVRGKKVRRGRQMVWFSDGATISAKEYAARIKKMDKELKEQMKADAALAKRGRMAHKPKPQPKRKLSKKKKRLGH